MTFTKKNIIIGIVILWVVFSFAYIVWDMWSKFQANVAQSAYQQGAQDVIGQLIQAAEDPNCAPIPVFAGEKQVELISTACVK
jgi:predicted negative regulator of RcsB-dependent stress response